MTNKSVAAPRYEIRLNVHENSPSLLSWFKRICKKGKDSLSNQNDLLIILIFAETTACSRACIVCVHECYCRGSVHIVE